MTNFVKLYHSESTAVKSVNPGGIFGIPVFSILRICIQTFLEVKGIRIHPWNDCHTKGGVLNGNIYD